MRYLAIDLGGKRTGLALGDDDTAIVTALDPILTPHEDEKLRQIGRAIDAQGPDALVLGLPLNMDGTQGPAAAAIRQFAEKLTAMTGLTVHLADERLTSADADEQMARTGLTHRQKKQRRDGLAAAAILERFLREPRDNA